MTGFTPGPWVAESQVHRDEIESGLAIIAVLPKLEQTPGVTPTRGMVAWVNSGLGACSTDEEAIATTRLIAQAPTLLAALEAMVDACEEQNTFQWLMLLQGARDNARRVIRQAKGEA